ncbi:MAG: Rieske 2Fe-2S domain-containing protein [Methyloprofundus sp.]|nr:Rieske 2Fe-2S domain-containing protein [Methyloprofundus sp.]
MNTEEKKPKSRRELVRTMGQSGNYWYAMEESKNLKKGKSLEVIFWKSPIALYRGESGKVHAIENRCPHRQLRLSSGIVEGEEIICQYHGWNFNGCGQCTGISHELGKGKGKGKSELPNIKVNSYPVQERYGLIWVFPGDPALSETVKIPAIPQLDQAEPWEFIPIDVKLKAHYSMMLENVCDFNHAFLHRKFKPFTNPHLLGHRREGDTIWIDYETDMSQSSAVKTAGEKKGAGLEDMTLWYQYPYQGSNTADKYLHWLFMTPIDENNTRCFFVFLLGPLEIPLINKPVPKFLRKTVIWIANKLYIIPLLGEDTYILAEEMLGQERHPDIQHLEFNPIVGEFQKMSIEKWEEYVHTEALRKKKQKEDKERYVFTGAGLTKKELRDYNKMLEEKEEAGL